MTNLEDKKKLPFKRVNIDNKIYTFIISEKQEIEFQEILRTKNKDKAIQYMQLHFGYFVSIDYNKAYDCIKKQVYYC